MCSLFFAPKLRTKAYKQCFSMLSITWGHWVDHTSQQGQLLHGGTSFGCPCPFVFFTFFTDFDMSRCNLFVLNCLWKEGVIFADPLWQFFSSPQLLRCVKLLQFQGSNGLTKLCQVKHSQLRPWISRVLGSEMFWSLWHFRLCFKWCTFRRSRQELEGSACKRTRKSASWILQHVSVIPATQNHADQKSKRIDGMVYDMIWHDCFD